MLRYNLLETLKSYLIYFKIQSDKGFENARFNLFSFKFILWFKV